MTRNKVRLAILAAFALVALAALAEDDDNAPTMDPTVPAGTPPNIALDVTDNWACLVCHLDFETETLTAKHVEAGISCSRCHGPSDAHQHDEMSATTPDFLFGRQEIEPLCKSCHPAGHEDQAKVDAFLAEWRGKQRPNGRTILDTSTCTDCHGEHVIPKK